MIKTVKKTENQKSSKEKMTKKDEISTEIDGKRERKLSDCKNKTFSLLTVTVSATQMCMQWSQLKFTFSVQTEINEITYDQIDHIRRTLSTFFFTSNWKSSNN